VAFSGEIDLDIKVEHDLGKVINVNIPANPDDILVEGYGEDVLNTCKTSYNHKHYANSKPMFNIIKKASFPCSLLPEKYYHHSNRSVIYK
jgi:hypothetical protein